MPTTIKKLLEIQDKDLRIFQLKKQVSSSEDEKTQRRNSIKEIEQQYKLASENRKKTEAEARKIEKKIDAENDRLNKLKTDSAQIRKNEEYRARLKEIEQASSAIEELEDKQLGYWEILDKEKIVLAKKKQLLEEEKRRLEEAIKDIDQRNIFCKQEMEKVRSCRTSLAADVAEDSLIHYQRIIHSLTNPNVFRKGIVPLSNDNCGGCFLKVTPQIKHFLLKGDVAQCEHCGVMLFIG